MQHQHNSSVHTHTHPHTHTRQHLDHYMAVLILYPWTRCLFFFFSLSFSIFNLCFIIFWVIFEVVTSVHPTGTRDFFFFFTSFQKLLLQQQVPEQTNKRICNGALKRCRELYERLASDGSIMVYLEGSQTNSLFDNCKEIQVVTVLQHRNTRGYIYDSLWAVNTKCYIILRVFLVLDGVWWVWTWLYWYLLTCVQTV